MVEIRNLFRWSPLLLGLLALEGGFAQKTDPHAKIKQGTTAESPVIAGDTIEQRYKSKDEDPRYQRLIRRIKDLGIEEQTIRESISNLRQALSLDPSRQKELSDKILPMESRMLAIHKEKGIVTDSINLIEQYWFSVEFTRQQQPYDQKKEATEKTTQRTNLKNLVLNSPFKDELSQADYRALRIAQHNERTAADMAHRYMDNHTTITELAAVYDTIRVEAEAVKIQDRVTALQETNRDIADSLHTLWNNISDSKTYAYTYIADVMSRSDLLEWQQTSVTNAAQEIALLHDSTASNELIEYFTYKKMMLGMEQRLADAFALYPARDSLEATQRMLQKVDYRLPKCHIEERYFIDYEDAKVTRPSIYNYKNPIPKCTIYERGTIYRIQLGTFSAKRPVTVFRNVSPLSYELNENRRWVYYAGGYATYEEAVKARDYLKKIGFRAPEIVVWNDGEKSNLAHRAEESGTTFRVEIAGKSELSDAVRALIAEHKTMQFSRINAQLYVLGGFYDKSVADKLAADLMAADNDLEVKVVETPQE